MQEDDGYAKSLGEETVNNMVTRAKVRQRQQMSSVNDHEHLQTMLDMVSPPQVIQDSEEDDDDQPRKLDQLEQLEEVVHGQPYVPDHYEDKIHFHGSAPQYTKGSPAEMHYEDSK